MSKDSRKNIKSMRDIKEELEKKKPKSSIE